MDWSVASAIGAIVLAAIALVDLIYRYRDRRRPPAPPPQPQTSGSVKHNLPPKETFVGRDKDKVALCTALSSSWPVVAIEGLGGMGKTALARTVAWGLVDSSDPALTSEQRTAVPPFQAVIWTEDKNGNLTLNELLDTIGQVLEGTLAGFSRLPPEDKRKDIVRRLRKTNSLLIVDNFETIRGKDISEFLRTNIPWPPSKALITSREKLVRSVYDVPLGEMEFSDAMSFLKGFDLSALAEAPEEQLSSLYEATGGNPHAIRLAAGQMRAGDGLLDVIGELQEAKPAEIFEHIYGRNWNIKLKDHPGARRAFMTMPLFGRSASDAAIGAVGDVPHALLGNALDRLDELNLIVRLPGSEDTLRYEAHQLTRAYARKKLMEDPAVARAMQERFIAFFLGLSEASQDTWKDPGNVERLEGERENLLEAARQAGVLAGQPDGTAYLDMVIRFSNSLYSFLWGRGHWSELITICERGAAAAEQTKSYADLARLWARIGRVHAWRKDFTLARKFSAQSWQAVRLISGDTVVQAIPLRLDGQIAIRSGHYDEGEKLLSKVLEYAPLTADDDGRAATLIDLGIAALGKKRHMLAKERFEEALDLDLKSGTVEGQAVSMTYLAKALSELNEGYAESAQSYYERGLELAAQVERPDTLGHCQLGLAKIRFRFGYYEKAKELACAARDNFGRLRMTREEEETRTLLGQIPARYKSS